MEGQPTSGYVVWDGQPTDQHETFERPGAAVERVRELLHGGARMDTVVTVNLPLEPERKDG